MPRPFAYLRATHPLPAIAVSVLSGALLAARGVPARDLFLGFICTAAGQASVGWSNDYLDRDRDRAAARREKPVVAGEIEPPALRNAAVLAAAVCLGAGLLLGTLPALFMGLAVASAWSYNLGLKSTIWSWLPYAVSFALLPLFAGAVAAHPPSPWIPAGGAVLGVAAHLMNALPDLDIDRGMRGLPHRLGARGSLILASGMLAVALVLAVAAARALSSAASRVATGVAAASVIAAPVASARGDRRLGFRLTVLAAAAVVLVVVVAPDRW